MSSEETAKVEERRKKPKTKQMKRKRDSSNAVPFRRQGEVVVIDADERDRERIPINEEESRLLNGVLHLPNSPFKSTREILRTIRRLALRREQEEHGQSPLMVEHIVTEIQNHRALLAEARALDDARLMSEQQHEQDLARQRQDLNQSLESAFLDDWKTQFFPRSCILNNSDCAKRLELLLNSCNGNNTQQQVIDDKRLVLRLLNLEKKACRWYSALGRAYFTHKVCSSINSCGSEDGTEDFKSLLLEEVGRVEKALFCLSGKCGVHFTEMRASLLNHSMLDILERRTNWRCSTCIQGCSHGVKY